MPPLQRMASVDDEEEIKPVKDTNEFHVVDVQVGLRALFFPDGTQLALDSPRLKTACLEAGVVLDDIFQTPPAAFFKPNVVPELAAVRFDAAERDRLGHLEVLLRHRQTIVDRQAEEKEAKGSGGNFGAAGEEKPKADVGSSMIGDIMADVERVFQAKQRRLEMETKLAAESERLAAQRDMENAARDAELLRRQAKGAQMVEKKRQAAAELVQKRERKIEAERLAKAERERLMTIERAQQEKEFARRERAFARRRRRAVRETEQRNQFRIRRMQANVARQEEEKNRLAAQNRVMMQQRSERLAAEAARRNLERSEQIAQQQANAQARLEKDARDQLQQLATQFNEFETKMTTQQERKKEREAHRQWMLEQQRMEQEEAYKASQAKRDEIKRRMTEAAGAQMSKRDADNARVEAAIRRKKVQHQVEAERSRLAWLSKFEVVKRNHRISHHQWEMARDASEAKMKKLAAQNQRKRDLFQEKRDVITSYNLKSEKEEKMRQLLKERPGTAPSGDGVTVTWKPLSDKELSYSANLCYGRTVDAPVNLSGGRHERLSELMAGVGDSLGSSQLSGKLEQSLALGNWVIG